MFAIQRMKEKERFFFLFWLILVNDVIFSPHNQNNQLINTKNNAFDFLGKRVFSEKNNDAIKSFWTAVFSKKTKSPSAKIEVMFAIQGMKEKERFFFRLLTDFS